MSPVQPPENLRTRKRTEIALREERGWQGGMGNWKTACLPYSLQRIYVRESGRKLLCEKKGAGRGAWGTGKQHVSRTASREFTYAKADGNCSARRKGLAGGYGELENSMPPVQSPENLRTRKRTEIALREERGWQGGMRNWNKNWNKKWRKLWE